MAEKKTYELVFDENNIEEGVYAISLVDDPAIQTNFVYLNDKGEHKSYAFKTADKEKQIVLGAVLIPNLMIPRINKDTGEKYEVMFSKDTIEKLASAYMSRKLTDSITLDHSLAGEDINVVESWVIEDTKFDKARKYGFTLPAGTWMCAMKVNNKKVWDDYVKTGELKGFSVEARMKQIPIKLSKENLENSFNNTNMDITKEKLIETLFGVKLSEHSDKEKEKKELEKDDEKVKMERVQLPEGVGEIEIPEDVDDMAVEVQAHGKTFIVHVYEKQEVNDPSETGEPVENPDEAVVDEDMKNENAELKATVNELSAQVKKLTAEFNKGVTPVKMSRTTEGEHTKTESFDVGDIIARSKKLKKQ